MHPDEKQSNRIKQLSLIHEWQEKYPGTIVSLSLNIQTVHAGDMVDGEYPLYDYTRWWLLENDPRSPLIQELFGEATIGNPRYPEALPTLEDLQEIKRIFGILNRNEK